MDKVKFNFIDVVIIVVVIAACAVGYIKLGGGSGSASDGAVKVEYQIELTNREQSYTTLFKPGDKVFVGDKDKADAEITNVEVKPNKRMTKDIKNGTVSFVEVPGKYDVVITLKSDGSQTDKTLNIGTTPIHVGEQTTVRGAGYAGYGYIVNLDVVK